MHYITLIVLQLLNRLILSSLRLGRVSQETPTILQPTAVNNSHFFAPFKAWFLAISRHEFILLSLKDSSECTFSSKEILTLFALLLRFKLSALIRRQILPLNSTKASHLSLLRSSCYKLSKNKIMEEVMVYCDCPGTAPGSLVMFHFVWDLFNPMCQL